MDRVCARVWVGSVPHLDLREPLPSARDLGDELDPLADLVAKAFDDGRNVPARGPQRTENDKYGPHSCYVRFRLQPFRPTARDAHLSSNPSQHVGVETAGLFPTSLNKN